MGKATIIEAQNSDTQYENSNRAGILGKLKGVFADFKHGTRNADRLYTEQLWDNRVFGSEDVMEALETRTLFGELDHPDGDRCETKAQNAAITITKLEKRPDEGVIYGEAEILDTPTGRILKTLADSGAKLGISSRGMGDEIYENGQNIIDPETYDFITFDVVVTPANKKARVSLTESKQHTKLLESFKKEIINSETNNQLRQIKNVISTCNIPNRDELLQLVENKIVKNQKINQNKVNEANKHIANDVLKEKYQSMKEQLDESLQASANLAEENTKLIEEKEFLSESRIMLKAKLKETNEKLTSLKDEHTKILENYNKVKTENIKLQENKKKDVEKNIELYLRTKQVANKKVDYVEKLLKENMEKHKKEIENKDTQINKLKLENKKCEEKVNEYSKILVENQKLLKKVKMLETRELENKNKLMESKKIEENKIRELESKVSALEEQNKKLTEAQKRFSELSFNPVGNVTAIAENFETNVDIDQDDIDLYNTLIGN